MRLHIYPLAKKKLDEATYKSVAQVAEQLRSDIIELQYIPFDEGTLQNVQTDIDMQELKLGNVKIVHDTVYANRLYFHPEYKFSKDQNVNARGRWWEPFITGDLADRPHKLFAHFLKQNGGGYIK
jgi:hypothetical protein